LALFVRQDGASLLHRSRALEQAGMVSDGTNACYTFPSKRDIESTRS